MMKKEIRRQDRCVFRVLAPVFLGCVLPVLAGCGDIFEDRSACPCYLSLDFSGCDTARVRNLVVWVLDGGGGILRRDTVRASDYRAKYRVPVRRGTVFCRVWGNLGESTSVRSATEAGTGTVLETQEGQAADPLYFYGAELEARGEETAGTVELRKEHLTVTVRFKGSLDIRYPADMSVICGRGIALDGKPLPGTAAAPPFERYAGTPDGASLPQFRFRLLRQAETEALILRVTGGEGIVKHEYPLGDWLVRSGYDMVAENLRDVELEIDFSLSVVTVVTEDWILTSPLNAEF